MPPCASLNRLGGILLAALVVGGCSSGSSSSSVAKSTTTVPASTTTTQNVPADKLAASTVVIQPVDAGPGFKGTAHDPTGDTDLGPCVNHDSLLSGLDYPTQADGQDLTNSSGIPSTDISSSVRVAPTVAAALASMAAFKAPGVLPCLTDLIKQGAPSEVTISRFGVTPLTVPMIGDDVFAFKVDSTVTQSGTTVHTTFSAIAVRKGRVLSELSVTGQNVVPPLSLATRLATLMATRSASVT